MKREQTVNLILEGDTYRVASNVEVAMLRAKDEIIFEKAREQGKLIGFFYIKK